MKNNTIVGAIKLVLRASGRNMTPRAIYDEIVRNNYYTFGAQNPFGVMRGELRTHSEGVDFPTASPHKYFKYLPDGTFTLLEEESKDVVDDNSATHNPVKESLFGTLRNAASSFNNHVKSQILEQLKTLAQCLK